jgi:hypothetical protein
MKGTTDVGIITSGTSTGSGGTGSFSWPIYPTGSIGNDFKVRIESVSQPAIKDLSNSIFKLTF